MARAALHQSAFGSLFVLLCLFVAIPSALSSEHHTCNGRQKPERAADSLSRPFGVLLRVFCALCGYSPFALGGAEVVGPILLGFSKPVAVLQRGAEVNEIVHMAALAVVEAQTQEAIPAG